MTPLCCGVLLILAAHPASPAEEFADRVLKVHQVIEKSSVIEPSPRLLVELSLRGLFKGQGKDIPDDLEKRLKDEKATEAQLRALLRDGYRRRLQGRDVSVEEAVDNAIDFMLVAIDPHAWWEPDGPTDCDGFSNWLGIGLKLRLDNKTGLPVVVTPIKDGPAYRAGIRAGDVITQITPLRDSAPNNDIQMKTKATAGAGLPKVNEWLLGPKDSKVLLTIQREGVKEPLRLQMMRGSVWIDTIHGWRRKNDDSWDYALDSKKKIGYMRITHFGRDTPKELEKALDEVEGQGIQKVILDLRCCNGGLLGAIVRAAGPFLDQGAVIVKVHCCQDEDYVYPCDKATKRPGLKLVCLINRDTVSGAEFFAAALQDHHRAVLVGERTAGRGSLGALQTVDKFRIHLTIGLILRSTGKKLDRMLIPGRDADEWGVKPDAENIVTLKQEEQAALKQHLEASACIYRRDIPLKEPSEFKDRQLQRALEILRP